MASAPSSAYAVRLLPLTLPRDMWLHLVRYLPLSSILSLSRSCHAWRYHCRAEAVWTILRARDLPQLDGSEAQRINDALCRAKDHHELAALLVDELPPDAAHTIDWVQQWNDRPAYVAPPMFRGIHLWTLWRTIPAVPRGLPHDHMAANTAYATDITHLASLNVPSLLNEMQYETVTAGNSSLPLAIRNAQPDNHFKPMIDFRLCGTYGDDTWQPSTAAIAATRRQVGRRALGVSIRPIYRYDASHMRDQPSITSHYRPSSAPSMMSSPPRTAASYNIGSAAGMAAPIEYLVPSPMGVDNSHMGTSSDQRKLAFAAGVATSSPTHARMVRRIHLGVSSSQPADGSPGGRPIIYRLADNDDPQSVAAPSMMHDGKRMPALREEVAYEPSAAEWLPPDDMMMGHTMADGEITPRGGTAQVSVMGMASSAGVTGTTHGGGISPMAASNNGGGGPLRGTHMATPAWTVGPTPITAGGSNASGGAMMMHASTHVQPASIMDTVVDVHAGHHGGIRRDDLVQVPDHVVSVLQDKEWSPASGVYVLESTLCKAKALYMAHHLCDLGYTVVSSLQLRDLSLTWRYLLLLTVPVAIMILLTLITTMILISEKINSVMHSTSYVAWAVVFTPLFISSFTLLLYAAIIVCIGRLCPLASCRRQRSSLSSPAAIVSATAAAAKKKGGNAIMPLQVTVTPTYVHEPHRRMLPPSEDSHQELDSPETRVWTWLYRACTANRLQTLSFMAVVLGPAVIAVLATCVLDADDVDHAVVPLWTPFAVTLLWIVAYLVWCNESAIFGRTTSSIAVTQASIAGGSPCTNWRRYIYSYRIPVIALLCVIWIIQLWAHVQLNDAHKIRSITVMLPLWIAIVPVDGGIHAMMAITKRDSLVPWTVRAILLVVSTLLMALLMTGTVINAHIAMAPLYPLLVYHMATMILQRLTLLRQSLHHHLYLKGVPHFWSKSHLTQTELNTIRQRLLAATARYTAELGQLHP